MEKSHIETGQGNPVWGGASRACKRSKIQLLPLLGVPQNHQVNNLNINAEDVVQTIAGPLLTVSVSVRPCELCLVDLLGLVLLVFSTSSDSYSLSSHHLWSSRIFKGRDLLKTSNIDSLYIYNIWLCISPPTPI